MGLKLFVSVLSSAMKIGMTFGILAYLDILSEIDRLIILPPITVDTYFKD